jgi:MotA/TolQ/ExbB proton channel family protein
MHAASEGNSISATATSIAMPLERRLESVPPPVADERDRHPLFLRWVLFQAVVLTLLLAGGLAYAGRLHGASLVVVPLILAVLAGTSGYAGLLAWRTDEGVPVMEGLRHLWFAAGSCQLLGLLGTVAGFYAMFEDGTGTATAAGPGSTDLATRVTHGAGVALSATFVGILSSLVILLEHHVLDRER